MTDQTSLELEGIEELRPLDDHNLRLAANVHPTDWENPTPQGRYNLVVIGAGTAGLVTAAGAAGLGARVALVERILLGGDCLNVGCVPSKALIRSAHVAAEVRDAGDFGVRVRGDVEVDFPAVMERMRKLRADISPHDSAARFRDLGIDVFMGEARFERDGVVRVGDSELRYSKAVVATGARAAAPPIPGLDGIQYLTNETVFSLTELPRRLGIIGAGPIGCELAQAFARFGSQVFLVEAEHGVLPREDPDAAALVLRQLERDGVRVLCCGRRLELAQEADGTHLKVESHDRHYDEVVDRLLVAVGRAPNVEGLNLEAVGVSFDRQGVKVDDRLRTTNRRIFAAGDVCSPYKFTHAADAQARIVIQNALFFGRSKASLLTIPWATYTAPEVAHVGLYEHEAESQGIAIDTFRVDMAGVDRAILDGDDSGFLKVHVKRGSDRIVGATVVARNAGDLVSEITLAMVAGKGLATLSRTIHPYPTQAEVIKRAGDAYSRTRLTPTVRRLFDRLLAWQR
ncbi:MAG: mercuric reductase [Thermoanaerobaculia bacterium]|nr:mercuric reductase [Thermoanaerobaculia bacterium]